jgi:adenylate kinase
MGRWVALTGTPGTGKSSIARCLPRGWSAIEVAELGHDLDCARPVRGRGSEIDLACMRRRWPDPGRPRRCVVGHLAHLLPVQDVVVLRCRPDVLARRLARARRGSARSRYENATSEAIDLIAAEALGLGHRIWEVDTTEATPGEVARHVEHLVERTRPSSRSGLDWLADPRVTDYLLRRRP